MKKVFVLLVLAVIFADIQLLAVEKKAELLLVDGFEKMIVGDQLRISGNDEWICRDKCKVVTSDDSGSAPEGKHYLRAVAVGKPTPEERCKYLKIDEGATEGGISRSLASLGIGPEQIQGKQLHFSMKVRGKGYIMFYIYRRMANGGGLKNGVNPHSQCVKVSPDWETVEWDCSVPSEPDAAEYLAAIHFFTYNDQGIDLDDFKLEVIPK